MTGCNIHGNGNGNNGGATHEQYFNGDVNGVLTQTNCIAACGDLATHALKTRFGTNTLSGCGWTSNASPTGAAANAGAIVDVPNCGRFSASVCTFNLLAGSPNHDLLSYGSDGAQNATKGMQVSLRSCVVKDGTGTGGVFRAIQPNSMIDVTGMTYTGTAAPQFIGWASVTGTPTKV